MRIVALVLLASAQMFDYLSFIVMVDKHGLDAELNPIVVAIHQHLGLAGLTMVKAGATLFLACSVLLLLPRRPMVGAGVLAVGIVLGVVGGVSNVITI